MPGTLNVGGHDIITHSGDAGAGDVTVNVQNRLVLNSSGNVGIGNSNPSGTANSEADNLVIGSTGTTRNGLTVLGSEIGTIAFGDSGDDNVGRVVYNHTSDIMQFVVNGSERMRIDSSGRVGIGTNSPNSLIGNRNGLVQLKASGSNGCSYSLIDDTGSKEFVMSLDSGDNFAIQNNTATDVYFYLNGSERMRIDSSGNVNINNLGTGTVYSNSGTLTNTNPSDLNLKENVVEISYGLSEVRQLRPVEFDWIADEADKHELGFIAQEVQLIIPDLVNTYERITNEETGETEIGYGLESTQFIPVLVKAIQEQQSIIEALTTRIEALENA